MRKIADILQISVLISLTILTGSLFIKVGRESAMQLETRNLFLKEDTASTDMNLTEEEKALLSSVRGQALPEETADVSGQEDEKYKIQEDMLIIKKEYKSDTEKVMKVQEKITDNDFDYDFSINNRGRIDRRQQFKPLEAELNALMDYPVELADWWDSADKLFEKGIPVIVIDVETGKSFGAERTYGSNHADVETLTAEDTTAMMEIWGGEWNWERRAVIVVINGKKYAASASGMPHAGLDNMPEGELVENRSGDFGTGSNLDKIKGNNMDGHFDIHFLNSRTHGTDKIDELHQVMIPKAFAEGR